MTLSQWKSNGWLKAEPTSREEIANLLAIVERDQGDATGRISPDWQFGIALQRDAQAMYDPAQG